MGRGQASAVPAFQNLRNPLRRPIQQQGIGLRKIRQRTANGGGTAAPGHAPQAWEDSSWHNGT